mgnify:FL=1|tara:strand:- start:300 stop:959 length:660 start_codon:yes stop_codon:yes gene_type:complete
MKIFLDCSDVDLIKQSYSTGLIDGVTTNPSLMLKNGHNPLDVLKEITSIFPWDASISAEVVGETVEDMLAMADTYLEIAPNITIKVPCTRTGLKACKDLSEDDVAVNVTLIFSAAQAILASKAGATYVSPFVGRLNDQYWDGIQLVEEIADVYATHGAKTQVLAASIREPLQIAKCFRVGADICTLPWDIFNKMYDHILTDQGMQKFDSDWSELQSKLK